MSVDPDPWEDEGYAGEDDWGEESISSDLEEQQPAEGPEPLEGEPGDGQDA